MAFLDQWKLAMCTTPDAPCLQADVDDCLPFRSRVQQAMVKVATDIQGEAPTASPATDNKRAALADNVLGTQVVGEPPVGMSGSELWLDTFALAVTSNATITSASSDNDIEFQITAVWNDIAGVTGRD